MADEALGDVAADGETEGLLGGDRDEEGFPARGTGRGRWLEPHRVCNTDGEGRACKLKSELYTWFLCTFRVVQFQFEGFEQFLALCTELYDQLCFVHIQKLFRKSQTSRIALNW